MTDHDEDTSAGDLATPVAGSRHRRDHDRIARAIVEDWLADTMLTVHLAREHNMRVDDVSNEGLALLIDRHDHEHGAPCFAEAEEQSPDGGLRRGLAFARGERQT